MQQGASADMTKCSQTEHQANLLSKHPGPWAPATWAQGFKGEAKNHSRRRPLSRPVRASGAPTEPGLHLPCAPGTYAVWHSLSGGQQRSTNRGDPQIFDTQKKRANAAVEIPMGEFKHAATEFATSLLHDHVLPKLDLM